MITDTGSPSFRRFGLGRPRFERSAWPRPGERRAWAANVIVRRLKGFEAAQPRIPPKPAAGEGAAGLKARRLGRNRIVLPVAPHKTGPSSAPRRTSPARLTPPTNKTAERGAFLQAPNPDPGSNSSGTRSRSNRSLPNETRQPTREPPLTTIF